MNIILSKHIVWIAGASLLVAGSTMAGGKRNTTSGYNSGNTTGNTTSTGTTDSTTTGATTDTTRDSTPTSQSGVSQPDMTGMRHHESAMVPSATIEFSPGSSVLPQTEITKLRDLVANAKSSGFFIESASIAAWSDRKLPTSGQNLSDADRDLAEKRLDVIKSYLKDDQRADNKVSDIDTYNMAETSNWLARTFRTNDAELKSLFGRRGSETPLTHPEFRVIQREGGPSSAVIVLHRDLDKSKMDKKYEMKDTSTGTDSTGTVSP